MQYLIDLINSKHHKLVLYNQVKEHHVYMTVFDYSTKHGGTYDGFRYYNNYVIEIQ